MTAPKQDAFGDQAFASVHAATGHLLAEVDGLLQAALRDRNPGVRDLISKLRLTQAKWNSQTFRVATLALVKSGKSTLINALLGLEFLPAANTPETSRLVRVVHEPGAVGGRLSVTSGVLATGADDIQAALRNLNQQARAGPTLATPDDLVLSAPLQALSKHDFGLQRFEVLDTPGPNEAETPQLRARVEALLSEVDVIIYVLDYTKLKTHEEHQLLRTLAELRPELLRSCADRLFFIVNKIDGENRNGLTPTETAAYVGDMLRRQVPMVKLTADRIWLVSAEWALLARVVSGREPSQKAIKDFSRIALGVGRKDVSLEECRRFSQELLAGSGIPALEQGVLSYIFDNRARLLLQGILEDASHFLLLLDNYLRVAESALREDHEALSRKAASLKEDMASILASLQEIENATEHFKLETGAWIRNRFEAFQEKTRHTIEVTLDSTSGSRNDKGPLSGLLLRVRQYLFGEGEAADIRDRITAVNEHLEQHLQDEFERFRTLLEMEALDRQRLLFERVNSMMQPLARQVESRMNEAFALSLAPVSIRLSFPSLVDLRDEVASHVDSLIDTKFKFVPVVGQERYVVRTGFCSDDYGWREVQRLEFVTSHAVAVETLQRLWTNKINELTVTSVATTNAVVGRVVGTVVSRAKQELRTYCDGFLASINHELAASDVNRSTREERLRELTIQMARLNHLRAAGAELVGQTLVSLESQQERHPPATRDAFIVGSTAQTSVVFISIVSLSSLDGPLMHAAMTTLHTVLREKLLKPESGPLRVLSCLNGGIVLLPDASHLEALKVIADIVPALTNSGLAVRFGVAHGNVEFVEDADATTSAVGVCINIAARLANAVTNRGLLVHETYADHVVGVLRSGHWLGSAKRGDAAVDVRGKRTEVFRCFAAPADVVRVRVQSALVRDFAPQFVNAVLLAYDLPNFSSGDGSQLASRFRSIVREVQRLRQTSDVPTEARVFFSPGGDGAVLTIDGFHLSRAFDIAMRLEETLKIETLNKTASAAVLARISVHYGRVFLYQGAENAWRPTGTTVFDADALANDDAARGSHSVVVSQALIELAALGSRSFERDNFESIGPLERPDGRQIKRYVRKPVQSRHA